MKYLIVFEQVYIGQIISVFLECTFCQTDVKIMSDTTAHVQSKLKAKMRDTEIFWCEKEECICFLMLSAIAMKAGKCDSLQGY